MRKIKLYWEIQTKVNNIVDVTLTSILDIEVPVNFRWEFGGKNVYVVVERENNSDIKEKMTPSANDC